MTSRPDADLTREQHPFADAPRGGTSRRSFAALLATSGLLAACAGGMSGPGRIFSVKQPRELPSFAFKDGTGRNVTLTDFKGRPVLLNVWAPWCNPCIDELPALAMMRERFKDTPLEVIALSIDKHGVPRVNTVYATLKIDDLPPYADETRASVKALGLRTVPTTLLIDAQGREIGRASRKQAWHATYAIREVSDRLGLTVPDLPENRSVTAALPAKGALGLTD